MKRFFDKLSIANKLVAVNLVVVIVSLCCAFMFYFIDERAKQRQRVVDQLSQQAALVADVLINPLEKNDVLQMQRVLSGFRHNSKIRAVDLFDNNSQLIAQYAKQPSGQADSSPTQTMRWLSTEKASVVYSRHGIFVIQPIYRDGAQLGTLYVHADQSQMSEYLSANMLTAFLILLMASVMALIAIRKLVGLVTEPAQSLLTAAKRVRDEGNYDVRVASVTDDELGQLATAFNRMLEAISERDAELSKQHLRLEIEVQERTHALKAANENLENTVVALKQANRAIRISEESKRIAEASAQSKAHFLANMSHELRTPMNGVLGMLSLLNETKLDQEQSDYLNVAYESGHVLLELINNVLDLSKIEQGKLNLETIEFDVRACTEEVFSILASPAQNKGLEMILQWQPDTPIRVVGDPTRFKQLICNLVANAIKFTETGHIKIQYALVETYGSRQRFRFEVEDTGIGIKESVRNAIFEKFSQADNSTTRHYGGTGLGLALCKELTRLMDGAIGVTSQYGKGSTFWFEVTFQAAIKQRTFSTIGEHWLLLEPSQEMGDGLMCYLSELGCTVDHCADQHQFLDMLTPNTHESQEGAYCGFDGAIVSLSEGVEQVERLLNHNTVKQFPADRILLAGSALQRKQLPADLKLQYGFILKPLRLERMREAMLALDRVHRLPELSEPVTAPVAHVRPSALPNVMAMPKSKVLVVEDNQVNQQVAKGRLEKLGYEVAIADNGAVAVELFQGQNFDLIFMDCQMPVLDGFQATRRIRQHEQRSSGHVPIIAMTAHAMSGDRDQCIQAGMDDYMAKPFKTEELKLVLQRWL